MKAYLLTTATIFGVIAFLHVLRTVGEWQRLSSDPGFIVEGPLLGLVAAALCVWAVQLLRLPARR
jgi:hypothetical protein